MDTRHVMIIYNLILTISFKHVLEIGTHNGFSTTAFVEAIKSGKHDLDIHLCDIKFELSAIKLCNGFPNIKLHQMRSADFLLNAPKFDLAILDGSHIAEDVEDEFEYLSMNDTHSYIIHDVNTQLLPESINEPWYDGTLFLKNKLVASPDWFCIEDSLKRTGERTERGLFFATRDIVIYNKALEVFKYWRTAHLV